MDEPYVIQRPDGTWVMMYMGETGVTNEQIGYATANDLLGPYTKQCSTPCLPFGPPGSYDAGTVADPWVVEFHGTYYIGYTVSPTSSSPWQTAYATTTDWLTFTKMGILLPLGPAGAWDNLDAFRGAVTRIEGETDADDYYIFPYGGYQSGAYRMGTATQPVYQLPASINNNPAAVFDFYDAFDGSSLDTNKWTIVPSSAGTASVSGGWLTLTASSPVNSNLRINAVPSFGMNYLVESRARHLNAGTVDFYGEVGLVGPNDFYDTVRIFDGTDSWYPLETTHCQWSEQSQLLQSTSNHRYRLACFPHL